jgi:ATP-dependent Clp protease ATP-binding subunit ClpX
LIVKKGFRKKAGARGLRSVMEEVLVDVMYETPDIKDIERVTITADYIKGVKKPLYIISKTSKRTG